MVKDSNRQKAVSATHLTKDAAEQAAEGVAKGGIEAADTTTHFQ